jgi:hypothetical protein
MSSDQPFGSVAVAIALTHCNARACDAYVPASLANVLKKS